MIFESFVKEHGLGFYPIDLDPREVLVNQAIAGIAYWTGVTVDGAVMRARLKEIFG